MESLEDEKMTVDKEKSNAGLTQEISGRIFTDEERNKILVDWNATEAIYPKDQCIQQLFEAQVLRTPKAAAVVYQDQQLSYAELNVRANQLAHYLRGQGVGPDVLVAICVERTLEMIIGLLGILKAGGAYVPLDPHSPKECLAFMLEDTRAPVLVTQASLRGLLSHSKVEMLCLDSDWGCVERESNGNVENHTTSEQLAYVIYTSGSTGQPKGVEISHRNLVNLVTWHQRTYELSPEDRTTLLAGPAFDASVWEIWPTLTVGASLYIPNENIRMAPDRLIGWYADKGITLSFLPTPLATALLEQDLSVRLSLRTLLTGGEALHLPSTKPLPFKLVNHYGPTESTVVTTAVTVLPEQSSHTPPIGRPISNIQVYILDDQLSPVPLGVVGELYIGGDGLALGYLNRPELTAERFILNPLAGTPGKRLYKTGDLARYLPDGNIEFQGRIDHQVKIRGFRIELGEIESVLRQHPRVQRAVVLVREDRLGQKQLVAYAVAEESSDEDLIQVMRHYLQERLAEYMVPSAFVVLDELPLTPNGKIDRKALPAPLRSDYGDMRAHVAPRSDLEKSIVDIWSDLLGINQIGVYDDFLELGGHSLLATQLLSRIRNVFGVEISLADLYTEPTVATLAKKITNNKNKLADHIPKLKVADRNRDIPASFSQEQVVFLNELAPESIAYNFQATIHLNGELDVSVLERAFTEIIRRHEIFRTTFENHEGHIIQKIHSPWSVSIPIIDLRNIPDEQRQIQTQEIISSEIGLQFELTKLPLIRWKLLRLASNEYILIHIEHHLVHDGWSFAVFVRELKALYPAYLSNQSSTLAELPFQFADYAVWQRQYINGEGLRSLLSFWAPKFRGQLPTLELPTDFQRPPIQSFRGREEVIDLPPDLSDRLRKFSQREGTTLFITMFSVFLALLHRYTNQSDIIVGTGIASRRFKEFEGLIGMMVNAIALRNDLAGNPTFRELLGRTKAVALEAYAHQDLPFEKLVEEISPVRDLSRNPILQTMFNFHDSQVPELDFGSVKGKVKYWHNGSAKLDLNVIAIPWAEQHVGLDAEAKDRSITMKWEYPTDIFNQSTVQRIAAEYAILLADAISHPDNRISDLELLTGTERQQLLFDWNATTTDYPQDQCIQQLFEAQVMRTPDAEAVVYRDQQLSYTELNARTNRLAHYLIEQGVGADTLVALSLERSLDLVVAVVGILKAGGAYAPLDPSYPPERLAFMLEDTRAPVLITQSSLQAALPPHGASVLCLDEANPLADYAEENPAVRTQPHHLAYINYTSGSTGKPKGVMIPHQGVTRLVFGANYVTLDAHKTLLHMAPISFDAATFELWGALLHGGRCVLYPERVPTPEGLKAIIAEQGVDTLWLTAAFFNVIVDTDVGILSDVKQLLTGGEALSVSHIRKALQQLKDTQLINGYGPTESTTFTCCYPIPRVLGDSLRSIPIGRPISNTQVYILDTHLKPVPIGVVGELYIGGDGLARGYLNRPELTAECFIPNPLPGTPGEHLYKSGDRVRYLADGNIEFMGRTDDQVKIRGFRIELGEIEAILSQHPQVQDSLVMVREEGVGGKRLVGYVVTKQAEDATATLRGYLKATLPEYMVPSAFVTLDAFPLTPNGKVDKQALSAMDVLQSPETAYVAPHTPTEEALAAIWCELLGLERVGIHDNFFQLGGHSLLVTKAISRMRAVLHSVFPLVMFFEHPTIAEQASEIEQEHSDDIDDELEGLLGELEGLSEEEQAAVVFGEQGDQDA